MPDAETPTTRVTAVVAASARAASLQEVLDALRAQTRPPDSILLVDSDAAPDVREVLARADQADDVEVLVLGRSGGSAGSFGAGADAVAAGDADWVVLLDDDAVPAHDCLELLLDAAAQHPDAGAVGAASRTPDGELAWALNVRDGDGWITVPDHAGLRALAGASPALPVAELAWHALLIPTSVVRTLGGPCKKLFMWYEDVEFGLRLRAANRPLYVVPAAAVTHPAPPRVVRLKLPGLTLEGPVTDRPRAYLMLRNTLVVRHRYCGRRFWWVDLPLTLARGALVAFSLPGSRLRAARDVLGRGVLDAARGRLGPPPFA